MIRELLQKGNTMQLCDVKLKLYGFGETIKKLFLLPHKSVSHKLIMKEKGLTFLK